MMKAVLTGHSRGLGAALAEALLARRIPVLGLSRGEPPGLADRFPGLLTSVPLDLSSPQALSDWLGGGALPAFLSGAGTALLVNNAGLLQPIGPPSAQDPVAVAKAVALNVSAPLALSAAFVQATADMGDRRILHISSGAGRTAYAGWSVYCAAKAALDHHARAVALDGVPGLRIASVAPGVIDTDMQAEIRATPQALFPTRERFDALKESGGLASPAGTAQRLAEHLLGPRFGAVVDADVRTL